jgi:hypothetical protein
MYSDFYGRTQIDCAGFLDSPLQGHVRNEENVVTGRRQTFDDGGFRRFVLTVVLLDEPFVDPVELRFRGRSENLARHCFSR